MLVAPKSPLGKQLAELSGKGSPLPCSGDSQVMGDTSGCLRALWSPLSFPPPYFCQRMEEDQSHLCSSTQALIPVPAYPYRSAPLSCPAPGHLPPPGHTSPRSGDARSPLEQCRDPMRGFCCCAWESKGQGEILGMPRCPTVASAIWNLRHLRYMQPHRGVGTEDVFWRLEIVKAATPVSHSNSHHILLQNCFHLCYSLPNSVPTRAAEVHCWPLYFI